MRAAPGKIKLDTKLGDQPKPRPQPGLLPGGWWLWCAVGLVIGYGVWIGGRIYLKQQFAAQLATAPSSADAQRIITSLLRIDGDAASEIAQGLKHPDFTVANTAYRTLIEQLDEWRHLESNEQMRRMSLIAHQLDGDTSMLSEDHQMLICSLASRIYADSFTSPSSASTEVLAICKRAVARASKGSDPAIASTAAAQVQASISTSSSTPEVAATFASTRINPVSSSQSVSASLSDTDSEVEPEPADESPLGVSPDPVPPPLPPVESNEFTDSSASLVQPPTTIVQNQKPVATLNATEYPNALRSPASTSGFVGRATVHLTSSSPKPITTEPPMTSISLSDSAELDPPSLSADSSIELPPIVSAESMSVAVPEPSLSAEEQQTLARIDQVPIDQLVRLLGNAQPRIAQAATLALKKRGMPDDKLNLAIQLATGTEAERLALVEDMASRIGGDPRPWLAWMAEAGEPAVRSASVAQLATMLNDDVLRQLRYQLNRESDPEIAQSIRKILLTQP